MTIPLSISKIVKLIKFKINVIFLYKITSYLFNKKYVRKLTLHFVTISSLYSLRQRSKVLRISIF